MKRTLLRLAVLWLAITTAHAEEPAAKQPAEAEPAVHAWLEMQRSGDAASPQAQPLSGPVMDRVHLRYLKGFEYQQPMYFKHDESTSSGQ